MPRWGLKPNLLSLVAAALAVLLLLPFELLVNAGRYSVGLELVVIFILAFFIFRLLLEVMVYRRLRVIQNKIRETMKKRLLAPDTLTDLRRDPIGSIERDAEELIAHNTAELANLKELEHFRREFIGDVSHELKTPLFAIQGFLETLIDGALEDQKVNRKFLKQALKNVLRLNSLVQDLLVISQLDAGELQMKPEEFRIHELALDVLDLLDYKLTERDRSVQVVIDSHGNESQRVVADKERIRQVLFNLIDNAISYGKPDGTVKVNITPENGKIRVAVIDQGAGIADEHLPHIFNRFYRIEKSRSRGGLGGTGLGLAIVKKLVQAHGEDIWVRSVVGQGSTFEFTLPRL